MTEQTGFTHQLVNEICEFTVKHFPAYSLDKEKLEKAVVDHILYGTLDFILREGKVVACVRYNISEGGAIAHILDLAIDKEENGLKVIKYFIARGWYKFPSLSYIDFGRHKYNKRRRMYPIKDFFKGGK